MAIINRDELMTYLEYDDTEQDRVDLCIEWAQSRAESYIGRKLESDTFTWFLNGTGGTEIVLPVCPITSVTDVYLDSSRSFDTALDADDYYADTDTGIIQLYSSITPIGARTVKVTATAGFTSDTLPADLKMGLITAISHHMVKLRNRAFGMTGQTAPDGVNFQYEVELPADTKRVLDSYKDVRV